MAGTIEKQLSEAGYALLDIKNIENLILSILKNKNYRYFKAIPYIIYLHKPNINNIYAKSKDKQLFGEIINITRRIFEEQKIKIDLPNIDKKTKLNYEEFKQEFLLQMKRSEKPNLLLEKKEIYAERNLQMWLSQIFTKKEKYIITQILNSQPLSKTEYEYYSRKTKKKLNAIINLDEFAKMILPLSPKMIKI